MKVEVVKTVKYSLDGFNLSQHFQGEVADIPHHFALVFIRQGLVTPISDRQTKPMRGIVEIKSHNSTGKRTRNAVGS